MSPLKGAAAVWLYSMLPDLSVFKRSPNLDLYRVSLNLLKLMLISYFLKDIEKVNYVCGSGDPMIQPVTLDVPFLCLRKADCLQGPRRALYIIKNLRNLENPTS